MKQSLSQLIRSLILIFAFIGYGTIANADGGGRFLLPELPSGTTISIGDCSDGDWPANALDFDITSVTNPATILGRGKMVISHPDNLMADEELYLYIEVDDNTASDDDMVVIMFDNSHDEDQPDASSYEASDDRGIMFKRQAGQYAKRVYGTINSAAIYGDFEASRRCVQGTGSGDLQWKIEAKVLPQDLGLNAFSSLSGAAVFSNDLQSITDPIGRWPDTDITESPSNWVNLLSRPPIDYVLLIDQSGSMGGEKWTSAKKAADNFVLILSKLDDSNLNSEYPLLTPAMQGDRLGLSTFTYKSGAPQTPTVIGLTSVPSNPDDYISQNLDDGGYSPGGSTPIIAGVNHTFEMFGGAASLSNPPPRTRVVMLLSDGKHNTPTTDITITDFDYNASLCTEESLVRINTVAIGTDATVSTDKLDIIKDCYCGNVVGDGTSTSTQTYNITGFGGATAGQLASNLTKYFVQTLEPYYHWNIINDTGADFSLNAGERRLLLFAFWDNAADAEDLKITTPSGEETGSSNTNLGYSYLSIDNPIEGDYSDFIANGASLKMVLVDLSVEGRFGVDNKPHGTSSTITLRARLRENGMPILGADVRVDISRPEEGFGTVASTISPENCEPIEPSLPAIDPGASHDAISTVRTGAAYAAAAASSTTAGDVDPSHIALMQQILEGCGKSDLDRIDDSGLQLYDDETHGDKVAGDGLYTLVYSNTEIEGSYVFRFRASGTMANGRTFTRVRELAEYIRVDVDPDATTSDSRVVGQAGSLIEREYYIIPRDRKGGYLGPGHAGQVEFKKNAGTWSGPLRDYNNGIYSRVLQYDATRGEPEVTAMVQGKTIKFKQRPFEIVPFAGYTFFDNALHLDDGMVVGARFGYRLTNRLTLELEGGVTFTESTGGDSGNVIQTLLNARYDVYSFNTGVGQLTPYVTAGAGGVFFRGMGNNDEAFAFQGGIGATLNLSNSFGIRVDGRVLQFSDALNAGATTNYQVTGGVVVRF